MRREDTLLRCAIDARLGALTEDPVRRARIRQKIAGYEKPVIGRKLLVTLALVTAALLIAGGAMAVGFNLFEFFGRNDERVAQLAPDAALEDVPDSIPVDNAALGQTNASINSAYYDGQRLMVGFTIQNGERWELFAPSAEQFAQMQPSTTAMVPVSTGADAEVLALYRQALDAGKPFGLVHYAVYASDHTEAADGSDLPYTEQSEQTIDGGVFCALRKYDDPLPPSVQGLDELTLRIRLWEDASYLYFDGQQCWMMSDHQDAGAMTVTIPRTEHASAT